MERTGKNVIRPMMESEGGSGGVVVCLGVGGLVDLGGLLGLENAEDESGYGGVELWIIDARRPWNLGNVYGGYPQLPRVQENGESINPRPVGVVDGKIGSGYKPGKGGIIVFDDGDIEQDMDAEREAYHALVDMPEVEEEDGDSDGGTESEEEEDEELPNPKAGQKRKSWSDRDDEEGSDEDEDRPRQRRRSNMVTASSNVNELC